MNKNNHNFELGPYQKNVSFKYEKLILKNEDNDENTKDVCFNPWDNNFELQKKIHITDDLKIHYKNEDKCLIFKLQIAN